MNASRSSLTQYFFFFFFLSLGVYFADKAKITYPVRSFLEKKLFNVSKEVKIDSSESADLQAEIISLREKTQELEKENELFRKQLQAPLPPSFQFIPAEVVFITNNSFGEKRLRLYTGGKGRIETNLPVLVENIIIGKINQTGAVVSSAVLLADKESKLAAKTEKNARGIVFGGESQEMNVVVFERILQKEEVDIGDKVLTSGEDDIAPNLLIGEVFEVESNAQNPYKKAKVKLFLDPQKLSQVFIVQN